MSTVDPVAASSLTAGVKPGWIRSRPFDLNFIVTIAVVAFASGAIVVWRPSLVMPVLMLDLWLLGFHHVVSTFTRLVFDRQSFQEHRFLVVELPVIVLAATIALAWGIGIWTITTTYLYWQWFHYTRQSYGIERAYRRKADSACQFDDRLTKWTLYLVPLLGITYRSWQGSETFLGMPVYTVPVPDLVFYAITAVTAVVFSTWAVRQLIAAGQGQLAPTHFAYQISHHVIFITGYLVIPDVTVGWIVLNVWHNLQYIMFVWVFNNSRFENSVDPDRKFLSTISQRSHIPVYLFVCVAISTIVYLALTQTGSVFDPLPVTLVATMAINFHHYIVDGIIWKRKKRPVTAAAA